MRKSSILVLALALGVAWSAQAFAAEKAQRTFVGTAKCKICHKKAAGGEQYVKWQASKHAKAFEVLAGEEAKKIAAKLELGNPQEADECLRCHVTGHGVAAEFLGPKYAKEDGVGCESCHGAGGDYYKKKTMKAVTSGEIEAASVGLTLPTKETCVKCHNDKSPTFVSFDFDKFCEKIAHPMPAEYKAKYKTAGGSK